MEVYKNKTATELAENSMHTLNTIKKKNKQKTKPQQCRNTAILLLTNTSEKKKSTFLLGSSMCQLVLYGEVFSTK